MIIIKRADEIKKITSACEIVSGVLREVRDKIKVGASAKDIDRFAEEYILKQDAYPAFKGYYGYPSTLCVSINSEVVHGIPTDKKIIKDGDIVSVDVGVKKDGYYGDAAFSVAVGNASTEALKLVECTKKCLQRAIEAFVKGGFLGDIGSAIESCALAEGFSVVREWVGHGIGKKLHEDPQVLNYGRRKTGDALKPGMVFAIEPMVNAGKYKTKVLNDKWTVVTDDNSLSAHFEHTVALTENGPVILTEN